MKHQITIALLILSLALGACSPAPRVTKAERKTAPNFSLKDADGRTVQLSDYRGKVVLLNFWATWCGPCRLEIPWFIEFERKHKDRGFAVVGVSMDDGWSEIRPFLSENRVNYRVVLGDDAVAQLYGGVENLPTTFVIDREGKIVSQHIGLVSKPKYEAELEELLGTSGRVSGLRRMDVRPSGAGAN